MLTVIQVQIRKQPVIYISDITGIESLTVVLRHYKNPKNNKRIKSESWLIGKILIFITT